MQTKSSIVCVSKWLMTFVFSTRIGGTLKHATIFRTWKKRAKLEDWELSCVTRAHVRVTEVPQQTTAQCIHFCGDVYNIEYTNLYLFPLGVRDNVAGCGTMLQVGKSRVRVPTRWTFFNLPIPSSCTMALGSTQHTTEMRTRNHPGGGKAAGA
jgi:hypothetical protein